MNSRNIKKIDQLYILIKKEKLYNMPIIEDTSFTWF